MYTYLHVLSVEEATLMHYFKLDFNGSRRFKFSHHEQLWIYLLGPWRGINSEWLEEGLRVKGLFK